MGVAIYGNLDLRKVGTVSYLAVYGDQDLDKDGEIARNAIGRGLIDQSSVAEVTADHTAALGITWDTPLEGLRLNSSYYQSNVRLTGSKTIAENVVNGALKVNNYYTWTTGAEYTWNDLVVAAEYRQARVPSEFSVDGQLVASMTSTGEYWYVSSDYRFADWFTGEISYSEAYPYRDDKNGDRFDDSPGNERFYAWSKIWSFNGRFDINDYWILKAGIDFNNGMATGFNFQNPDGADEDWILYQLKTTVTF
jgi:predicted porin